MKILPLTPKPPSDPPLPPVTPPPTVSTALADEREAIQKAHLERLWRSAWRYWWIPSLTLLLTIVVTAVVLFRAPPTYISTASMWETEKFRMPDGTGFADDLQNYLGTQIELLRSEKLSQMAVARVQAAYTNAPPHAKSGQLLKLRLNIRRAPRSSVLLLEVPSPDPEFARRYLDALMAAYLEYKQNLRQSVSSGTFVSISRQALRLEQELKEDQAALSVFQRTNNLAVLEEEAKTSGAYLARLKTQLSDLHLDNVLLEALAADQAQATIAQTNAELVCFESAADATGYPAAHAQSQAAAERQNAVKELELLLIQRESLSKNLRPKHPKIIKLDDDIERARKLLDKYHLHNREQLAAARRALKLRIDNILVAIKEWEATVVAAKDRIAEAERLRLNIARAQSLYERLTMLLQNVDLSRSLDQETLAILEPASAAERSYRFECVLSALAIIVGLAAGAAIVFLVEVWDDRLTSWAEVSGQFTHNILGQVPELPTHRGQKRLLLLKRNDDRHLFAESYRNLRSGLLFLPEAGNPPKILLITSALPSEGKSTIAANLSRALAFGGSRVLLVDADFRQGRLEQLLRLQREPGLAELLENQISFGKVIQTDSIPNLWFIARGRPLTNPGDLLLKAELLPALNQWRKKFDYIVLDSSPVFAADDVTALAPKADATLFVVRSRFSRAGTVHQALELLAHRRCRVLGLILNRVDASVRSHLYYKYPGYSRRTVAQT